MSNHYSNIDTLPQKTSLNIDTPVNYLKNVTQINSVQKNKKVCAPIIFREQLAGSNLIRLKRRKFGHTLSKVYYLSNYTI